MRLTVPARTGEPWTEEEDRVVAERWFAGDTVGQIADALERTRGSVMIRLDVAIEDPFHENDDAETARRRRARDRAPLARLP